jgi:gliding motility-associated-like protein
MIFTLLAALFGAAQEAIVVYEGATTNHFVEKHPGSSYAWEIFVDFSPDINAPPDEYEIIGSANLDNVHIRWLNSGIYYLKVTETDLKGCENLKVLPVRVIMNNRSIGFLSLSGSAYFNATGNGFGIPVLITDDNGQPLSVDYFPLVVEFMFNGKLYSQELQPGNPMIRIQDEMVETTANTDFIAKVEIISARDVFNDSIPLDVDMKTHIRTILAYPQIEFETFNPKVEQGSQVTSSVKLVVGELENPVYHWSLDPVGGSTTNLSSTTGTSATILWNGPPGIYTLQVFVSDGSGFVSETISQQIQIVELSEFIVDAGRDTIIGNCQPYQLFAKVDKQSGETYTYTWAPVDNLDNPDSQNPVFRPGKTTQFVLTVTNSKGVSVSDSVTISVANLFANAGTDVYMEQNSSVILDGSASTGSALRFKWTTNIGKIDSGDNTANPIVSGFGAYYLEITDSLGCTATDSVVVYRMAHAPVANDDYDTTRYLTEVKIPVLNNDTDKENSIVPSTLTISMPPANGTAYVDFDDYTVHYRPNESFSGTDNFEYQVCNIHNECDRANVYVMVTDFKFLVPNAFSPNGDGINDYFEILGIEYYEGNSITIINRWGNKVYEAKNYGIDTTPKFWDGKANTGLRIGNEELPTGTYYYVLNLGNGEKPIGGSIYLDR